MQFKKEITAKRMQLVGQHVTLGKYTGLGYRLEIISDTAGLTTVLLCGVARELLGLDLAVGEEIKVNKITFEFEKCCEEKEPRKIEEQL